MRLLIMGPPGAGKGTQATVIAERLSIPAISTGEIFRASVAKGTRLGLQAQGFMDAGEYVPDTLTNEMVRERLAEDDARGGFLLDGYPRTLAQVEVLDGILAQRHTKLDRVLQLSVPVEEVVSRLLRRAAVEGRTDDTEDVIRRRLEIYAEQTAPLLELYASRGVLVQVAGDGPVEEVTERAVTALDGAR